ncbi:FecR/PupR family sigma factor regulator [Janthinobacterium agaricidamnosum]|uniref:FecR/PupR family sigma factor regulator n=1 Tax=Janthinobacterium agaricidamnosum TaxID=55508 RepID=UPI0005711CE0|nr:FecR/PupR family sigma factor regulator [Janthinobacterium agaricidamnosum]
MNSTPASEGLWQIALDWVLLQHEGELSAAAQAELTAWLSAAPAHRAAYDEASRVWLATGLVPPSTF